MVLGTNESRYAWMDEGFTSFAESLVSRYYADLDKDKAAITSSGISTGPKRSIVDPEMRKSPHYDAYQNYFALVKSGLEEPLTTHADHFETNFAYSIASYSKGEVFLEQLGYIVGAEVRDQILLDYYDQWKFKHPNVNDFIRVAEKRSGIELDWYQEYWVNTTKTIDYGIDSLYEQNGATNIRLKRNGKIPMPIDVVITYQDGTKELHYIPMNLMFGSKPVEDPSIPRTEYEAWRWTHPTYVIKSTKRLQDIKSVEIDPSGRLADVNPRDNKLELKW
jgi:aminopeptidase N